MLEGSLMLYLTAHNNKISLPNLDHQVLNMRAPGAGMVVRVVFPCEAIHNEFSRPDAVSIQNMLEPRQPITTAVNIFKAG